jgi:predicted CXXCH cytochrome family protein
MGRFKLMRLPIIIGVVAVLFVLALSAPVDAAPAPAMSAAPVASSVDAAPPGQETETYCLSCHGKPDLSMTLPDGEKLSLFIDPNKLSASVHSPNGIECEACHTNIKTYPHPAINFQTRRDLSRAYYEACQKCHPANYTKTQDSVHAKAAAEGNANAPICTDCHGAHDVQAPAQPRAKISTTCSQCHADIYNQYKDSVHGAALIQQDNPDVPVCTDCHGVHNIQDPRTAQFRIETPDLCAGCHADPARMNKYGISTDVYSLYRTSFHGVDISVYRANWPTIWHDSAVCTDCHGVHDILPASDPKSTVNPANLLATCQKCHPGAGPNWTAAWTGHNKIDPARTPFLYYVEQFYSGFTPFVLWLSIIYVALQIIRAVVGRVQRSLK